MPGFTHLQVAQPVTFGHHLHGLLRDVQPRRRAPGRLPPAREPAAAGRRGARRHELPDRPRVRWRGSWASTACARTRSTRSPIATSRSNSSPPPRSSWRTCRAWPRSSIIWMSPRFGFVEHRRPLLHRLLDHAAEEEPGRARSSCAARPGACTARSSRCSPLMKGAAARLQQGQPGGQGAALRHGRHAARRACAARRAADGREGPARSHARGAHARVTRPPPTSPTTWFARACRSATPTKSWRARCGAAESRGQGPGGAQPRAT